MVMLVYLVGVAVIAAVWFFHFRTVRKASMAAGWPTAPATIQASSVRENIETDAEGDTETAYYPNVHYSYAVDGQTYTGDRIEFGGKPRFARLSAAEAVCDRYPHGATVPVRYNPDQPGESVLESKAPSLATPGVFTVVVVLFTLIGGAFVAPA